MSARSVCPAIRLTCPPVRGCNCFVCFNVCTAKTTTAVSTGQRLGKVPAKTQVGDASGTPQHKNNKPSDDDDDDDCLWILLRLWLPPMTLMNFYLLCLISVFICHSPWLATQRAPTCPPPPSPNTRLPRSPSKLRAISAKCFVALFMSAGSASIFSCNYRSPVARLIDFDAGRCRPKPLPNPQHHDHAHTHPIDSCRDSCN